MSDKKVISKQIKKKNKKSKSALREIIKLKKKVKTNIY